MKKLFLHLFVFWSVTGVCPAEDIVYQPFIFDAQDSNAAIVIAFDLQDGVAPFEWQLDPNIEQDAGGATTLPTDDFVYQGTASQAQFSITLPRYENPGVYGVRVLITDADEALIIDEVLTVINERPHLVSPILYVHGHGDSHKSLYRAHHTQQWLCGAFIPSDGDDKYDGELLFKGGYDLLIVGSTLDDSLRTSLDEVWKDLYDPSRWNNRAQDGYYAPEIPAYTDEFGVSYEAYTHKGENSRWFNLAFDRWNYLFKKKFHQAPEYYYGPDYKPKCHLLGASMGTLVARGYLCSHKFLEREDVSSYASIFGPHNGVGVATLFQSRDLSPVDDYWPFTGGYPSDVRALFNELLNQGKVSFWPFHLHLDSIGNGLNLMLKVDTNIDFFSEFGLDMSMLENLTGFDPDGPFITDLQNPNRGNYLAFPKNVRAAAVGVRHAIPQSEMDWWADFVADEISKSLIFDVDPGYYPYYKDAGQTLDRWQTTAGDDEPAHTVGQTFRDWLINEVFPSARPPAPTWTTIKRVAVKRLEFTISIPFQPIEFGIPIPITLTIETWLPWFEYGQGDHLIDYSSHLGKGYETVFNPECFDLIRAVHGHDALMHRNKLTILKAIEGPPELEISSDGEMITPRYGENLGDIRSGVIRGRVKDFMLHCLRDPQTYIDNQFHNVGPPLVLHEGDNAIEHIKGPDYNKEGWYGYNEWLGPNDLYANMKFDGYTIPEWYDGTYKKQEYLFIAKEFIDTFEQYQSVLTVCLNDEERTGVAIQEGGYFSLDLSNRLNEPTDITLEVVNPAGRKHTLHFYATPRKCDYRPFQVKLGGYLQTSVSSSAGGEFMLGAFVDSDVVEELPVLYQGMDTGLRLRDDGLNGDLTADDGFYSIKQPFAAGARKGRALLEIGYPGDTTRWPYFVVGY